jgi:hypothetical protein
VQLFALWADLCGLTRRVCRCRCCRNKNTCIHHARQKFNAAAQIKYHGIKETLIYLFLQEEIIL